MKRILQKVTGTIAVYCLICCIDLSLYELSPWIGGGFIDILPLVIIISAIVAVIFGGISIILWRSSEKRSNTVSEYYNKKETIMNIITIFTGIVAFYGMVFILCFHTDLSLSSPNTTFLNLTYKNVFIIHRIFTIISFILTILFIIIRIIRIKKRNNTSLDFGNDSLTKNESP